MPLKVDNALVDEFMPLLQHIANNLNYEDADDLVQVAWVRILEDAHKFEPSRSEVRKWIGRVGYTAMLNELKRMRTAASAHGPADMSEIMASQDMLEASPEAVYEAYERLVELFEEEL